MNEDLERRLKAKHPILLRALRDRRFRQPIGYYGIECGEGWCALIDDLCTQIDSVVKREGLRYAQVQQVKEKPGFLEFYLGMDEESSTVERLIQEARERSAITCEKCGAPAECRTDGWLIVLCDAHHEDRSWVGRP